MPTTRSCKDKSRVLKMLNTVEASSPNVTKKVIKRKSSDTKDIDKNEIVKTKKVCNSQTKDLNCSPSNRENSFDTEADSKSKHYETQVASLQKILSANYINVVDRLKLDYTPNCIRDLLHCKNNHSKNCPTSPIISHSVTTQMETFLAEKRPLNYLKACNNIMQQGMLLSENILNSLFQLIITFYSPDEDLNYTNDYIVNESKMVFISFINNFPPCWKGIRNVYDNICTNSVDLSTLLPENYYLVERRNMFLFLLDMIEKLINEVESVPNQHCNNSSMDNSSADSEILFNFKEWEIKNSQANNMNALNREEKLKRCFLCLEIFVKIFESDLSLWILRYLSKPNKHLFTNDKPLILGSLLIKESNPMSEYVHKVINLFTLLVLNNYSKAYTDIFKRLVSLLSVIMNLMDTKEESIKYPIIKMKTIHFAKEIFESFKAKAGLSFNYFNQILENIEIPCFRLLVIDYFLKILKTSKNHEVLNPQIVYENFSSLSWQQYPVSKKKIQIKNGNIQTNSINILCDETMTFPKVISNFKSKAAKLSREEYLYLCLEALKTYCDTYKTKNFLLILMDCQKTDTKISLTQETKKSRVKKKFNLEKLEKDAPKMLLKIDLDASFEDTNLNETTEYNGVEVDSELILQYRNDFKYLSLLKKNLPAMVEKFGKEFDIFTEFIDFCFSPQ